jgi:RimJ/RimL family protein N-acetyltransferase
MNKNICRLNGDNVYLSILRDDEAAIAKYIEWMSNESTALYIEKNSTIVDVSEMPGWVRDHSVMRMGIVYKQKDELIGYCHIDHRTKDMAAWLSVNIGEPQMRGQGLGTEVVGILLKYCFLELGVHSVHLDVLETNTPAVRCYEKAGFTVSGKYREHGMHNGIFHNWLHMDILRNEWKCCQ